LEHVSKAFGGTQALADVSLTVNAGEIHGLLGENGSGKSTLIKVLSGYHEPDEGATCRIRGEEIALPIVPSAAKRLGLSFVHQDLGLVPSLSILENLRLRDISTSHARWINWHREELRARDVFARFGVALDPRKRVSDLDPTERALLAIVRAVEAMHDQRGLLVLDEPTVFLSARGIQRLFGLLRDVVARHASVLFVSHNLEEVRRLTHRVTVLRDGRVQGTVSTQDVGETELIQLILGGGVKGGWMAKQASADRRGRLLLSVKGLRGPVVKDVTVDVHAG
jgi:ribose transport system ATP-binding protein